MMSKLYTCTTCKKKKQAFEFHKRSSRPKGITSSCKLCIAERDKLYRDSNSERLVEKRKLNWSNNATELKQKQRLYRQKNLDKLRERDRDYYNKNKSTIKPFKNAVSAARRALKLKAMPKWLSTTDIAKIRSIYKMSRQVSKKTGNPHHVDHIVPLVNDKVCGLHVPWNLRVIPREDNLQKSNTLIEDIV